MENVLKISNVEKYYGNKGNLTKAVDNISFNVKEGEFVGIMGASGSGKTTLLNCIATIDTVTSGNIMVDQTDITRMKEDALADFRRCELGFVFQDFNLLDTLTIRENIALSLVVNNFDSNEIDSTIFSNIISVNFAVSYNVLSKSI